MERMLEFAGNHLFLVSLFFALLILLIWNLFGGLISGIMRVEPAEMTRLMNREHALVVDVRKEEDFRAGHVLHAINIPDADITARQKELEKARNKPLIVYCDNGGVSLNTARRLKALGFKNVQSLNGGMASWRSAGLPVAKENGQG